jgi:uncharacterized membrane protein
MSIVQVPENMNRAVTKKDIIVLIVVVILFGIPFYTATVLKQTFPNNTIINLFFDKWWKTILILGVGIYLGWAAGKWIFKKMK